MDDDGFWDPERWDNEDLWEPERWDRPAPNTELWERLVRGECSRVVIVNLSVGRSAFELFFPQTLGLPPLRRFATALAPEVLAAEAESLAAADRWITEGPEWAEYFMPRAEAIISVEAEMFSLVGPTRGPWGIDDVLRVVRHVRERRRARRAASRQSVASLLDLALDQPLRAQRVRMKPAALAVAEDEYPEKLMRVTSRAQVRELRKVRAPR